MIGFSWKTAGYTFIVEGRSHGSKFRVKITDPKGIVSYRAFTSEFVTDKMAEEAIYKALKEAESDPFSG